ncbi:MAG TPA: Gfo/Idh/MocA family oxidoreductase [Azospira sp.]|nr:Gfo/Idh/MocA family oxidoreductase [Azospira sp.]
MTKLRLGVIGLSPGNGHPYSWSAICNGYDLSEMEHCGFPVIPRYLEKQRFPDDQIPQVQVTHVWAQDADVARHVAKAALIPNVVQDFTDMLGAVDGILLARDDGETHLHYAMPFLRAGVPVYVDKPLALCRADAQEMYAAQHYAGQLFSCSALRYAKELIRSAEDRQLLGPICAIHAMTPKDWDKYAVHVIEPALNLIPDRGDVKGCQAWGTGGGRGLSVTYSGGVQLQVYAAGDACAPLSLRVLGTTGWKDLHFRDSFAAFKAALEAFIRSMRERRQIIPEAFTMEVVDLIEAGREGV